MLLPCGNGKALVTGQAALRLLLHLYQAQTAGQYGKQIARHGPIPAHLLGNMWAQTWGNVLSTAGACPVIAV